MKKPIVASIIIALMLLTGSFFASAYAQDSANEEKPTFYRLIPGVYVNGWPRFTITYPKDWVEQARLSQEVFRAKAPGPLPHPFFAVNAGPSPLPLDKLADLVLPFFKNIATDVTVLSDKASQLRDGTPAREVEIQMVINGAPAYGFLLGTMRGGVLVNTTVGTNKKIGEGLKAIPYSLQYEPGKDEPVKLPPDVQEFLDNWRNAIVSHDVAKVMTHYSDRFLNSGTRKGEVERMWKQIIGPIMSISGSVTDFVAEGDRAYLTGFAVSYWGKYEMNDISIIKENGEWKWYGNQRDVSP